MNRGMLASLLVLAGCASAPAPAPDAGRAPAPALAAPSVAPDAGLVAAFRGRFEALKDAPACQATLVRDHPELGHALFLGSDDGRLRAQLAGAFARPVEGSQPTTAYLDAERARQAGAAVAPASFVRDLEARVEGALSAGGTTPRAGGPEPWPLAELASAAAAVRHHSALEALEAARPAHQVAPADWQRTLARFALDRRQPLRALRHAATLAREHGERLAPGDRLLLARAHQLAAQTEQSLAEALTAAEDAARARDLAAEASARALVAELMLDLARPDAAADEHDAAERLFLQAGDLAGRLRQAVNRAAALLRARRVEDAQGALAPVLALSLPGEEGADLTCRRDVTAAMVDLVAGRAGAGETARRVEQALDVARAAGAYRAVERYAALPDRLRPGPG